MMYRVYRKWGCTLECIGDNNNIRAYYYTGNDITVDKAIFHFKTQQYWAYVISEDGVEYALASRIFPVVAASVLLRGLPGCFPFWLLPVSSSRFLHFSTIHGCNDTLKSLHDRYHTIFPCCYYNLLLHFHRHFYWLRKLSMCFLIIILKLPFQRQFHISCNILLLLLLLLLLGAKVDWDFRNSDLVKNPDGTDI